MEIAALVLEFTKVLAWPVAVVALAVMFRTQLTELIGRIELLKVPGVEARLAARMANIVAEAEEIPELDDGGETEGEAVADIAHPERLLGRLLTSWSSLEVMARKIAQERGDPERGRNLGLLFGDLRSDGLISAKTEALARNVQRIRNDVVHHASDAVLTESFVGEFEDITQRLVRLLQKLSRDDPGRIITRKPLS